MSVIFAVTNLVLLTALVVLVIHQNGLLKERQHIGQSTNSMISNKTSITNAERDQYQCHSEDSNDLCGECAEDEKCISGCYSETFSAPACLAIQREPCDLIQEYSNLHHYFTPAVYPDGRDTGLIQFVTYLKKRADSGIRIQYSSNTIAHNATAGCNRWFVKFNGTECINPTTIEMIDYSETPQLLSRNMEMDGICYGVPQGMVNVEISIETCAGFSSSNGLTAWLGARQLTIMEILPVKSAQAMPCPALTTFNLFYETWVRSGESTFNTSQTTILIRSTTYYKLANDSALRIKYQAPQSVLVDRPDSPYCARWFVEINNAPCSPEGDFVLHPQLPNVSYYYAYHSRSRTLECICENKISAGPVLIELKIGKCHVQQFEPTHVKYGDLYRPSRMIIEEVRLGKSTDATLGTDGNFHRSSITNLASFHWNKKESILDNGDILNVSYTKRFSSTSLKLTSSGDHRIALSGCARWYFKINGTECGNPGVIDAVAADFYPPNVHIPMQTTGYCYGLPAGSYSITYSVGGCPGYAIADASTGWGSAFMIFIEEVRLDYMKSCYGRPANCN